MDFSRCDLSTRDQFLYQKHFNRRMQEYLDRGAGECHLRQPACVSIVRNQFLSTDGSTYHSGDFVIMPNHVHLLLVPADGEKLEQILRRMKGASSHDCNLALNRTGTFWQPESYDHIVRSLEQLVAYRDYIATNPQKAGISVSPHALYRADWMDEWFKA
jgi:type I restriction enzyme R subunit